MTFKGQGPEHSLDGQIPGVIQTSDFAEDIPYQIDVATAGAKLIVMQTTVSTGWDNGQGATVIDMVTRQHLKQDGNDGSGNGGDDGGTGEGDAERPNRDILIQGIHALADGDRGVPLLAGNMPHLANRVADYLKDYSLMPSVTQPNGPTIGRIAEVTTQSDLHQIMLEGTYLSQRAEQLVEQLANYDIQLASTTLRIGIFSMTHAAAMHGVASSVEVFISFPNNEPTLLHLAVAPRTLKYNQTMKQMLRELGLDGYKGRAQTGDYFTLPKDKDEALLQRINLFFSKHAKPYLASE